MCQLCMVCHFLVIFLTTFAATCKQVTTEKGFHGAWPGALTYGSDAEKRGYKGAWIFVHFHVLNPKMQEFALNKTIC